MNTGGQGAPATFALFYVVFTAVLGVSSWFTLDTASAADMYQACVYKYNSWPFNNEVGKAASGKVRTPRTVAEVSSVDDIYLWMQRVFMPATYDEQVRSDTMSAWGDDITHVSEYSPATLAGMNRILLYRITFTRLQVKDASSSSHFANIAPKVLTSEAYREDICNQTNLPCHWRASGGLNDEGGYSIILNPLDGKDAFKHVLAGMAMTEKVFDSAMSSFTVDVLVFNVQIEMFMHIAWRFECSLAGSCDLAMQVRSSSYRIFTDGFSDYIGFVAHVAMIPLVLIMWAIEASKFDFRRCGSRYLSKWGSLLDLLSITLCTVSLVFFWTMWFQSPWTGFDFAELFDPATQEQAYNVIVDQCSRSEEFRFLAAVNVLVVFLRMVGVVAALGTNLGLFLKVLEASCANMVAFSVMFLLVVIGMVFFIFFIFGSRAYQASSLARALYFLLSGLVGSPVYSALVDVDTMMADIFYPVYTVFYLTMLNVFISVLMSGYDVEVDKFDKQLKAGGIGNESLMSQFKREVHDNLWKPVQPCFSCVWSCIGPCVKEFACCNPQDLLKWCWNAPARPPSIDESVRSVSGVSSFLEPSGTVSHATSNFGTVSHDTSATDLRLGSSMRASGQVDVAECVLVSTLMAAFLSFLQLQSRNMSSFEATQVTMMSLETELHWEADGPYRIENYSTVFTMEGVGRWGHAACGALYEPASEQTCSVETEGEYQWDLRGRSCDSSEGNQQVVQRIGNWNIGFLSNTFVRMTVQPACYIKNAELLLNVGDTPVRATPNIECANEDCQRVLSEESCRTAWGTDLSKEGVSKFDLADESVKYADSDTELGSHGLLGGFVFNLGTNQRECEDMIATASDQKWFTKNAASIVFDWVTYNGNLDTFSFHTAAFSLMETGLLKKSLNAVTFNMNYTDGGGPFRTARLAILVLFALYALLVLVASLLLLRDLVRTVRRRVHDPSGRVAWWKIWFSNIWNLTDTISLALSLVNIIHIAFYLRIEFVRKYVFSLNELEKYAVPAEYEQEFQLANASDPARPLQDDYYYFYEFERVKSRYDMFLAIAGFNSFFIAIKVVKYVGNLSSIRVFSNTLWEGRHKNFGFLVILVLLMAGFGVFIHSYFGVQVYEVHTLTDASYTLFLCMLGQLDLEPYMEKDLPVAMVFYCVYIILFYFIAVNMFLATMLNTYSEAEGQAGIMKVQEEVAREQYIKRVAYDDVAELEMDVVLELRKNEWVVAEVKRDDGEASKKGVQPGARVLKVNRRRLNKGDVRHRDAIDMINDVAPPGRVVITFADPLLKRSSAFFGKSPGTRKATVRGFWRHQGAVAWIAEQEAAAVPQADQMDEAELCARLDDLSDSSDNSDGDGDTGKRRASVGAPAAASAGLEDLHEVDDAARQLQEREKEEMRGKLVKLRTKKRLDALLFSRWRHGEHRGQQVQFRHGAYRDPDGPAPQSEGARDGGSAEDKGAEQDEAWSDQDIDDLAEELNSEPTGPELWLDCLMGALEHEMPDESVIAEVLRTSDLPTDEDLKSGKAGALASLPQLEKFRARAQTVLRILEFKAHKKYYHALLKESERRQRQLQSQNEVLHEYACELEEEFRKLMQKKSDLSATKKGLLTKLAGLLAVPYDTPRGHHEQPGHHHRHHHRHLHPHSAQRSDAHG